VTNRGSGPTNIGSWTEQIWLTKDKNRPHPGQGDILLTSFSYNGGALVVGQGYDRIMTINLPDTLVSGEYYLTPWVDPYAQVLEDTLAINVNPDDPNEINNNNYKAGGGDLVGSPHIALIGTPPAAVAPRPDVYVHTVGAEAFEWAGEAFTFSWSVTNQGPGTASGGWQDSVYLSDSPFFGASGAKQFSLGSFASMGPLATGASYANSQTIVLEPSAKGSYLHVITQGPGGDLDSSNHRASTTTDVQDRIPDLKITAVTPQASAFSGEKTTVGYTVLNDSDQPVWGQTAYWTDKIYLSKDPTWIPDQNRVTLLATLQRGNAQPLGAHQSYTRDVEVTLPPGIGGDYFLYVFTNVIPNSLPGIQPWPVEQGDGVFNVGNAYERYYANAYEFPQNNMFQAALPVVYREPDLRVTDLFVPDTAAAGATIDVAFTVTNVGNRETRESSWTDRIYLSNDASLDNFDAEVASKAAFDAIRDKYGRIDGKLKPGESYTATVRVTLPYDLSGDYHLLAFTDSGITGSWNSPISSISPRLRGLDPNSDSDGHVREFQGEGNNITVAPIHVVPYTPPDLQISGLVASERATRGQGFSISYTVVNLGGDTPIQEAKWDDLVYLSRDAFLDTRADRFIGSITHDGGLAAGGSYSIDKTYTVPSDLATEAYYVFVVTDPTRYSTSGSVYEANERNNDRASDVPMVIELPPPTDLVVTAVTVPADVRSGQPISLSWTVRNNTDLLPPEQQQTASGSWTDSLFLSEDAVWDISDRPLGRASFSGTLLAGQEYTLSLDALMPAAAPGHYRVIVRTDIFNQLHEGVNEVNNRTASASTMEVTVDELVIGAPLATQLQSGQETLYKITVPQDQTLRVTLQAGDNTSANEIFLRHDQVPSSAAFDATYSGPLSSSLSALVPSTEPGTYYLLVRNFNAPAGGANITLLAELLPLIITDVFTDTGGDSRHVTTTIRGAQFHEDAIVKLVRPGIAEYEPLVWEVVDSSKIIATFDFTDAPHGLYDLKVINPDGSTAILPYRFLIERAIEPEVTIGIGGPRVILAGDQATYSIALQGISNLDAPYTYFEVGVPQLLFNPIVYGLPYLEMFTNVRGTPEGAEGSANADVPWVEMESITNTISRPRVSADSRST
jgi:hypothetical protein